MTLYPIMNASLTFFLAIFVAFASTLAGADFAIEKTKGEGLRVLHKGKPFAEYVVDQANKPYLYPVHGPTGVAMTRNYHEENRGRAARRGPDGEAGGREGARAAHGEVEPPAAFGKARPRASLGGGDGDVEVRG